MRNVCLLLGLTFALPACGAADDAAKTGESMAEGGALVEGPTGKSGDPIAEGAERIPAPPETDAIGPVIPRAFQGRWGLSPADCDPARAATGKLTVAPSQLSFYESRGDLAEIVSSSPTSFTGRFDFAGEGMRWQRTLKLERNGDYLRLTEEGGRGGSVDQTYNDCGS